MTDSVQRYRLSIELPEEGSDEEPLIIQLPSLGFGQHNPRATSTVHWVQLGSENDDLDISGSTSNSMAGVASGESQARPEVTGSKTSVGDDVASGSKSALEPVVNKVSGRQHHRLRGIDHTVYWFESTGLSEIPRPPSLSKDTGLQENDLYLHKVLDKVQAWRYEAKGEGNTWVPIAVGSLIKLPNLATPRYFVLTGRTGKPSFVSSGTVAKNYKEFDGARAATPEERDTTVKDGKRRTGGRTGKRN
ncbi:hypothetical protein K474DRAFT_1714071 [Panus rudis PR-1116 ss-1]|nr:hypothetical protein K474DRAFT_1714071 [Panus rudis PR-1116 ss-1]